MKIPNGVAMIIASKGKMMVPIKVGKIPPERPMSVGLVVRKLKLIPGNPFSKIKKIMKAKIRRVSNVAPPKTAIAPRCVYRG